ncbi:hypothetical protein CACET_c32170 [Clostridium aceticum]|uniref:Uncharacterized protein n=1 Tax=Clostridium aceticum TaxID=84022 RepID=A0A0D8I9L1_9CLOT|nr:helix-turn-helix domain-containing protein [Clostridium aceticum]AKL96661.1 hypothetical protein CACET_c32170 [Clostridium aceticum]KJF25901.1 hypothetical protein TZ02_16075 [Clostridium aceticum]
MFDKKKFRAQVLLSGKSLKDIADLLDINLTTLYRKMNGESDFYRNEIQLLCEHLDIKNPTEIFFAEKIT